MGESYAVFGRSAQDHDAIADGLLLANPEPVPGQCCGMDFYSDANGVKIYGSVHRAGEGPVSNYFSLREFVPYLPHFEPLRLKRLIRHAMMSQASHGNHNFAFVPEEQALLDRVLPKLVEKKLRDWNATREPVTFEVKVLGMGIYAEEFPVLLRKFVKELERQGSAPLAVAALLHGFDYCSGTVSKCWESLSGATRAAAYSSRHKVETDLNIYYGDLTDEDCQETMLSYGRPDLTLWRDTWVIGHKLLSEERARWMCAQIAKTSNRPGGFLMREAAHTDEFMKRTEYEAGD